jgi:hypothetical protein
MRIAGYVSFCVQLYCMLVFTVSLHVSAYKAIFKCVRCLSLHVSAYMAFFKCVHCLSLHVLAYMAIFRCVHCLSLHVSAYITIFKSVHCLSLHVLANMAIFKCVGYFIFICLKDSTSLLFLFFAFFSHGHTLHVSISPEAREYTSEDGRVRPKHVDE